MIAMPVATVGILIWIGLIAALIVVWSWMVTSSDADGASDDEAYSRRRVRREMRVIDGRCREAHAKGRTCPIYHDTDDMYEVWRDE